MNASPAKGPAHEGNVSSLVRRGCAQLFMVYAGLWRDFMPSAPDFLRKCGLGNRNLTIFRDPYFTFYECGVSSEINSVEALCDWTADHLRKQTPVREVFTVGNSAGAHAAITFGCLLGVDEVFAFSPQGRQRLPILRNVLARAEGRTRVNVFFDPNHRLDSQFAHDIADFPGVVLRPADDGRNDGHSLFLNKLQRDELAPLFPPYRAVAENSG